MSGRIRNPTELMQMSEEVQHMKARFAEEEDAELKLMEDADAADQAVREAIADLEQVRRQSASEEPELREELMAWNTELAEVETERDAIWEQVPKTAQTAYSRMRMQPAVAQVINGQCAACHVTVTSSGMQTLRKGDELVHCENCGRILVRD
jgi:predicted  nucleic acid-binding Zn-ribbon protein